MGSLSRGSGRHLACRRGRHLAARGRVRILPLSHSAGQDARLYGRHDACRYGRMDPALTFRASRATRLVSRLMKPPPFLIGATLLFWGWQTDHLLAGAATGLLLESAPWIKARWEFADQDFRRIWVFCALLLLAVAVYAFTASGGPGDLINFLQNPSCSCSRRGSMPGRAFPRKPSRS